MQKISKQSSFFFRRIFSFLYDSFLLIAIFFVVGGISLMLNNGKAIENTASIILLYIVLYAITFLFYCWFWRNGGQTLGMQAWRIKVVSDSNEKLTFKQCLLRYLSGSLLLGISIIMGLINASGKGLHDQIAGTKIVYVNK